MDNSLREVSLDFNRVIEQSIIEAKKEYDLVHARIVELSNILQEMEKTDLSENADYTKAKDERDIKNALGNLLLRRIDSMESTVETYTPTGFVTLGTTLDLRVTSVNDKPPVLPKTQFIVKIVPHDTSDATKGLIAVDSKVAAAVMGRVAGDTVEVAAPMYKVTYHIERIY